MGLVSAALCAVLLLAGVLMAGALVWMLKPLVLVLVLVLVVGGLAAFAVVSVAQRSAQQQR